MKKRLDYFELLISIVAGVGWLFAGNAIYELLKGKVWMPLIIGIYFGGLSLTLIMVLCICNSLQNLGRWKHSEFINAIAVALIIFIASILFQLIYQQNITKNTNESTSYIFLIDESGSMSTNDPNNGRATAISKVMSLQDSEFQFAVYSFDQKCQMVLPMTAAKNALEYQIPSDYGGGTDIIYALSVVIDDISSGKLQGGDSPRIILLSDGESSKDGLPKLLKQANAIGINICTVYFGNADEEMMQAIAEGTNGICVSARNIDSLEDSMIVASTEKLSVKRDLLSIRPPVRKDALFSAMRIVFLTIIGALFFAIKALLMRSRSTNSLLIPHLIIIAVGSLCIEVGMNILFLNQQTMRFVMCVCFVCLINTFSDKMFLTDSSNEKFNSVGEKKKNKIYDKNTYAYIEPVKESNDVFISNKKRLIALAVVIVSVIAILGFSIKNSQKTTPDYYGALTRRIENEILAIPNPPIEYQYSNAILQSIEYSIVDSHRKSNTATVRFCYVDVMALADKMGNSNIGIDKYYSFCIEEIQNRRAPVRTTQIDLEFEKRTISGVEQLCVVDNYEFVDILSGGTVSAYMRLLEEYA